MKKLSLAIACMVIVTGSIVLAEADGPDFWAVTDVKEDDVLNIREKADPHSKKIGEIPPHGTCIKNLGCVGGLTFEEFTTLSGEEKKKIERERPRWCKVDFEGAVGWVAGRYLTEGACDRSAGMDRD